MGRGFLAPALRAAGDRVQADGPRRGCAQGLDRQGTAAAAGPALARIKSVPAHLPRSDGPHPCRHRCLWAPAVACFRLARLFWALGVGVFAHAERMGAFKPNSAVVLRSPEWIVCGIDKSEQRFLASTQQARNGEAPRGADAACLLSPAMGGVELSLFQCLDVFARHVAARTRVGQKTFWRPNPSKPTAASPAPISISNHYRLGAQSSGRRRLFRPREIVVNNRVTEPEATRI